MSVNTEAEYFCRFDGKKLAALNQFLDQCSTDDMAPEYEEVSAVSRLTSTELSVLKPPSLKKVSLPFLMLLTALVLVGSATATAVMTCSFPKSFVEYEKDPEK